MFTMGSTHRRFPFTSRMHPVLPLSDPPAPPRPHELLPGVKTVLGRSLQELPLLLRREELGLWLWAGDGP